MCTLYYTVPRGQLSALDPGKQGLKQNPLHQITHPYPLSALDPGKQGLKQVSGKRYGGNE